MENMKIENNSSEKPTQVRRAVNLFYAALGIGVFLTFFQIFRDASGLSIVSAIFSILFLSIPYAISIFLIINISAGKNWARIIMLIWFLIQFIPSFPSIIQNFRTNYLISILVIVQTALYIIAFVFLFQGSSNNWFKYQSKTIPLKSANWLLIGLLAGLIPGLLLFFGDQGSFLSILRGAAGIPGGLIGAAIGKALGKQNVVITWIGAIIFAFILFFLWFLVLGQT